MKMKEFEPQGAHPWRPPLDPPMVKKGVAIKKESGGDGDFTTTIVCIGRFSEHSYTIH